MKDLIKMLAYVFFFFYIVPFLFLFVIKGVIEMFWDMWWIFAFLALLFVIAEVIGIYRYYKRLEQEKRDKR